jgi:hypothetical protein
MVIGQCTMQAWEVKLHNLGFGSRWPMSGEEHSSPATTRPSGSRLVRISKELCVRKGTCACSESTASQYDFAMCVTSKLLMVQLESAVVSVILTFARSALPTHLVHLKSHAEQATSEFLPPPTPLLSMALHRLQ